MDFSLAVGTSRLEAWFQSYASASTDIVAGEILTRLEPAVKLEDWFADLEIPEQFRILEWHLAIAEELGTSAAVHASINVHNSIVAALSDRAAFLDLIATCPVPVTFEFTETYPMPPVTEANRLLRDVRERGHRSALDDFGTGLNRTSLLTDYDFDVIKVDRSLHAGIEMQPTKARGLKLLLQVIDLLGKDHVVEGVETEVVHQALLDIGYSTFQGFLFHRPEPVADFLARILQGENQ